MKVPLLDIKKQLEPIRKEILTAAQEVIDSGQYILGPKVEELEQRIAETCGHKYAVGVSSGTDALLLSLMALEIGPGTAVLTSPFSFFATAGVIARLGAVPVFADIDPATYNMDPVQAEQAIQSLTRAGLKGIMPVHLYGQLADMEAIRSLARRYGLAVIEDAAQAIGAGRGREKPAGGPGDPDREKSLPEVRESNPEAWESLPRLICFSFYPTKNLGAMGDAGMVLTDDSRLVERLYKLRVHGAHPKYCHSLIGGNFRLDALQAAFLLVKLKHLDSWTEGRRKNAAYYHTLFHQSGLISQGWISIPEIRPAGRSDRHVFNQYVVRAQRRNALQKFLQEAGIGTEVYYPIPLHLQTCFRYLGYKEGDFPEAERAAAEVLALPVYPELTPSQQQYVVERIMEFYNP